MLRNSFFKKNLKLHSDFIVLLNSVNFDSSNIQVLKTFFRKHNIKCFFLPKGVKYFYPSQFLINVSCENDLKKIDEFLSQTSSFFLHGVILNNYFFYFSDLKALNSSLFNLFRYEEQIFKLIINLKFNILLNVINLILILRKHGNLKSIS